MKNILKLTIIATLAIAATVGFAQGGGGGGGGGQGRGQFGRGGGGFNSKDGGVNLLGRKDVAAEIKLTDDQQAKLADARKKMQAERQTMRDNAQASGGGDPEAMRAANQKLMDDYRTQVMAILTPDQLTRLAQINIQMAKNRAIMDADIQSKLGITDDQKAKIKDLQDKMNAANQEIFQKMRDGTLDRTQIQPLMQKNNETLNDELGKILTPDQASKLKDLGGAQFTPTDPQPQFGGRGGGGGGGRRNRGAGAGGAGAGGGTATGSTGGGGGGGF